MNLKVPGAILPLGCAILSTRAITVRGVGTTPLRRTRVNACYWCVAYSHTNKDAHRMRTRQTWTHNRLKN